MVHRPELPLCLLRHILQIAVLLPLIHCLHCAQLQDDLQNDALLQCLGLRAGEAKAHINSVSAPYGTDLAAGGASTPQLGRHLMAAGLPA